MHKEFEAFLDYLCETKTNSIRKLQNIKGPAIIMAIDNSTELEGF